MTLAHTGWLLMRLHGFVFLVLAVAVLVLSSSQALVFTFPRLANVFHGGDGALAQAAPTSCWFRLLYTEPAPVGELVHCVPTLFHFLPKRS